MSSSFADLHARITPFGAATRYHFEYDTRPYGVGEAPHGLSVPAADVGIGSGGATGGAVEEVLQHLAGLSPGTEYHFRVVAVSEVLEAGVRSFGPATVYGTDGTFTTLPLPGAAGRAYELVTPAARQGNGDLFAELPQNGLFFNHDVGTPTSSGNGFMLETFAAFGPFPFAASGAYAFTREPGKARWGYTSLASPALGVQTVGEAGVLFDPLDLSRVAFTDGAGALQSETGETATSLTGPPGGPYTTLHEDPTQHAQGTFATDIVGGSQDLSHVVLESTSSGLCTAEPAAKELDPGSPVLCEWDQSAQEPGAPPLLSLVDESIEGEGRLVSRCGAVLGLGSAKSSAGGAHPAVSADGSRVVFTAPDPKINGGTGCWSGGASTTNTPQLYVRSAGHTVQISAPEPGVSDGSCPHLHEACHPAVYWGASEDGSRVFFLSESELTSEAQSLGLHDLELYQWEARAGAPGPAVLCGESSANYIPASQGCLTRVSAGEPGGEGLTSAGARVETVMAVAAEGGAVYFTAFGKLTEDASSKSAPSVNLYRYETVTGRTTYVTAVATHDIAKVNLGEYCSFFTAVDYFEEEAFCPSSNWYTTPDGRFLLFPGAGGLTRYDSGSGVLTVIARGAKFARSASSGAASGPLRAMSDDGEYVFFDSSEPLVTQASAGTLDVYQWHHGVISLIGSANSQYPSFFLGYSPNPAAHSEEAREGGNVFIGTHANLVPGENTESQGNIFDARVCEPESPCIRPPAAETVRCSGGDCQTPPPAPVDQTPRSFGLYGASGNVSPGSSSSSKPPTAAEVRAKKLAVALKLCRKKTNRHKRAACETQARRKYGPVKAARKSAAAKKAGRRR